jgi:HAD superfamily hydrolase (TIGR01509 family)
VLVDTEGLYFRATQAVLKTVGVPLTAEQFMDISMRRGESTLRLATEFGIGHEEIACLRARRDGIYAESLRTELCLIDGAEDALRSLHGQVRMGVVTSTRREHFEIAHARTGLTKYLDFVIVREDCQYAKPNPESYLTAIKRHELQPQECVVIEDSERGLVAAIAAGLECLIVRSEWSKDGDFTRASEVLRSIRDVPEEVMRRADGKRGR